MPRTARELIWYSRYQPQTLQAAVVLLYLNAALSLLLAFHAGISAVFILVDVFAGLGIANSKRWGFILGLIAAVGPIVLLVLSLSFGSLLSLLFWIALLALLAHPQSRQYIRAYFR